jgi:adenylate cyclase
MTLSFRTVRAKLIVLVAVPVVLILATMPVLSSALHKDLMAAADDHVEDAATGFQVELDDDLADLTQALRVMATHPDTRHAVETGDAKQAIEAAGIFGHLYPDMDLVIAQRDGQVLAKSGPTAAPVNINEMPELRAVSERGEVHAVLENGCSKADVHSPPSRAVMTSVGQAGWVVACQPLGDAYLENTARKLGLELALLHGMGTQNLHATTRRFPRQGIAAGNSTSLLEIGPRTWAIKRFVPKLKEGSRGSKIEIIAAADLSNVSDDVHKNLYMLLAIVAAVAAVSIALGSRIAGEMSRSLKRVIDAFRKLEQQQYVHVPVRHSRDELEWLASGFNHMVDGLMERDKLRTTFGKYMTESVLRHLLSGKIELGGKTLTVTILFSDIRSFTTISESMDAQSLVKLLNEYFTEMVSIVMRHNGVVDKYIGDAIMAVFGAPVPRPEDAENAVRAAVDMRRSLARLNQRLRARGAAELNTGIGIHTGEVVAGNIGSERRMEYTVIGDAVNLASRLESNTKQLAASVLISQATYELTQHVVRTRPVKEITVKGRAQPVMTYEVLGLVQPSSAQSLPPEAESAPIEQPAVDEGKQPA